MSLVEARGCGQRDWLQDGGRCGSVRGAVSVCYRAVMLMLMLFVDRRYCVTDLLWVSGGKRDFSLCL